MKEKFTIDKNDLGYYVSTKDMQTYLHKDGSVAPWKSSEEGYFKTRGEAQIALDKYLEEVSLPDQIKKAKALVGKRVKELGGKVDGFGVYVNGGPETGQESYRVKQYAKEHGICVYVYDDLFTVEVVAVEEDPAKVVEVKLNASYTASVSRDGIKVGCQTFPLSILDALNKAAKETK